MTAPRRPAAVLSSIDCATVLFATVLLSIGCASGDSRSATDSDNGSEAETATDPGYRLDVTGLDDARDTIVWAIPDLDTRRFDAVEVAPLRLGIRPGGIQALGVTERTAQRLIVLFDRCWTEQSLARPPLGGRENAERPLIVSTRLIDRNQVPELDTAGSKIDETDGNLARVCLLVEFFDPAERERVAAFLTQRDAHHFEAMLRGELEDVLAARILRPRFRLVAGAITPPAPSAADAPSSTSER